jgi:hypothetical protein
MIFQTFSLCISFFLGGVLAGTIGALGSAVSSYLKKKGHPIQAFFVGIVSYISAISTGGFYLVPSLSYGILPDSGWSLIAVFSSMSVGILLPLVLIAKALHSKSETA